MEIKVIAQEFSVCKIADIGAVDYSDTFLFLSKTDEELSLVCSTSLVPDQTVCREDGWRALRVQGVLDFSMVGILAEIAGVLAKESISIFAVSTYNTDYILTKKDDFERAVSALKNAGYTIRR